MRNSVPVSPPAVADRHKKKPGSTEDGASWSNMCESLPACRAAPCARRAAYVRQPNTAWSPGFPPAGNPGMKKPPATKAGGTGISAGRCDLIAATRAAVAAAFFRAGPVLQEVICHAKHQPQGGDPFLVAGDAIIIVHIYRIFYGYFLPFSVANKKPIRKVTIVLPKSNAVFIISLVFPPRLITAVSKTTKKANAPKHQQRRTNALFFKLISC